jgi:hypothetical protein
MFWVTRCSLAVQALEGTRWKRAPERLVEESSLRRLSQDSEGEVKTSELLHIFKDSLLLDTSWQLDNRVTQNKHPPMGPSNPLLGHFQT